MFDQINTAISVGALAISSVTAWLTYGRRGTLRMSQPAVIYFGPDGSRTGAVTVTVAITPKSNN